MMRRGDGRTVEVLPDGILDTGDIKDRTAKINARLIYHTIEGSGRPMCFDEIERAVQRARGYEVPIDPALRYLIENDFIAKTERNRITAYDLKHRV